MLQEALPEHRDGLYIEEPVLMVPQHVVQDRPDIRIVMSLPPVLPPEGLVDEAVGPLIPIPVDEIKYLLPTQPNNETLIFTDSENQQEEIFGGFEVTASGIMLMTGVDIKAEDNISKGAVRRTQRLNQYDRLLKMANFMEGKLDNGRFTPSDIRYVTPLIRNFRRMGMYRYIDEFAHDPFSYDTAKKMNEFLADSRDKTIDAEPQSAKNESRLGEQVYDSVGMHTGSRTEEVLREEQTLAHEEEMSSLLEKYRTHLATQQEEEESKECLEKAKKFKASGTVFHHDKELDEPSAEAAAFIRELWERPF